MSTMNRSFVPALLALSFSMASTSAYADEWPFELLIDLELTGIPLLVPVPITAPPIELPGSNPAQFLKVDNRLYFTADDRTHGGEAWVTDGTADGTNRITDICPGECSSSPVFAGILDGDLVFWADDGLSGLEPWATDGTVEGTRQLADTCPGECDGRTNFYLGWLREFEDDEAAVLNGRLFFVAESPETGREIWLTDGTAEGTRQVADLCEGPCHGAVNSSGPLAATEDRVVFVGDDGAGRRLWATDGQTVWEIKDFCPGPTDLTSLWNMERLEGRLVMGSSCDRKNAKLWITDGTSDGTEVLALLPNDERLNAPWVWDLIPLKRGQVLVRLQFFASQRPNQFWITDGTPDGTFPYFLELPDSFDSMTRYGKRAALVTSSSAGNALWITDGTADGTREIEGITVTESVGAAGNWLLFEGFDDLGNAGLFALQGDGTPQLVSTLDFGSALSLVLGEDVIETGALDGRLIIPAKADPEEGAELWVTPWFRTEFQPTFEGGFENRSSATGASKLP